MVFNNRMIQKRNTLISYTPSLGPNADIPGSHTGGTWTKDDLYQAEMMVDLYTDKIYIGGNASVLEFTLYDNANNLIFKNDSTVTGSYNLAAGQNNTIIGDSNIVGGSNNTISDDRDYNLVAGTSNEIKNSQATLVVGSANFLEQGSFSLIAGNLNQAYSGSSWTYILGAGNISSTSLNNFITGTFNTLNNNSQYNLVSGYQNTIVRNIYNTISGYRNELSFSYYGLNSGLRNITYNASSYIISGGYNVISGDTTNDVTYSSIIGGVYNNITNYENVVIVGGSGITATENQAVFVPKIILKDEVNSGDTEGTIFYDGNNFQFRNVTGWTELSAGVEDRFDSNDNLIFVGTSTITSGDRNLIAGGSQEVNGSDNLIGGSSNVIVSGSSYNIMGGASNYSQLSYFSFACGYNLELDYAQYSSIVGQNNTAINTNHDFISGKDNTMSGTTNYSSILGGNHNLVYATTNTSVIACSAVTATESKAVYVPKLILTEEVNSGDTEGTIFYDGSHFKIRNTDGWQSLQPVYGYFSTFTSGGESEGGADWTTINISSMSSDLATGISYSSGQYTIGVSGQYQITVSLQYGPFAGVTPGFRIYNTTQSTTIGSIVDPSAAESVTFTFGGSITANDVIEIQMDDFSGSGNIYVYSHSVAILKIAD